MKVISAVYQNGLLTIESGFKSGYCDVGLQTAKDGRIWLCVDGKALIRFKPMKKIVERDVSREGNK